MAMVRDLNGVGGSQTGNTQATKNQKAQSAEQTGSPRTAASAPAQESAKARDSVQISSQAQALAAMEDKLKDVPDVNQKRVNELREAINAKRYNVDAARVADKMLKADEDLL